MLTQAYRKLVPEHWRNQLRAFRLLSREYGQFESMKHGDCRDHAGEPTPWYTYPAIEYLKQLDLSDRDLFEYGSGNSTLFWAKRCRSVVSVEDDEGWYQKIRGVLPDNVDYTFISDADAYSRAIDRDERQYDVIVIDGSHRIECAQAISNHLAKDGFVILDNADWLERTSAHLRSLDLIEVDMAGFGPINSYTWTTSFYFSRGVRLQPAFDRQPAHPIGAVEVRSER